MLDLESIFGDRPAATKPAPEAPNPKPQAAAEPETPAGDAAGEPFGGLDFSGWVRRPDCEGRMGWEAPDLPEETRWWARWDFDELPELLPPDNFGRPTKPPAQDGPDCQETKLVDLEHVKRGRHSRHCSGGSESSA